MSDKLAKMDSGALARPQPTVADMLQAVIDKGITADNVAAMGDLVKLYERMEEKKSEREFAIAFNALQSELPVITAKTVIPNRGKYEKYEDLMKVVGPLLAKHGFTVSYSMDFKENRILETLHLMHVGGHSTSNSFAVRSGKADTDTQADCKAATTAKRNALCNALNIVIRQDVLTSEHDASIDGDVITKEQVDELSRRVQETDTNKEAFLKFAGVKTFQEIPAGKYAVLDGFLAKKEARGR